ncbi:MAG: ribonuclease H-like domain-containing protein [Nitrospiraceae bacterium]|nr:MAG: ribonuclease H-like domain-containing protein [Nitrospiraceae bacterium]
MDISAYLDIETTGLRHQESDMTVVGIHREDETGRGVIQLVGKDINAAGIVRALEGVTRLFTYNGGRFDLPFIRAKLALDLLQYCCHEDLMHACWKRRLYGGLKSVERQLGIERRLPDVDGWAAVQLWNRYRKEGHRDSLMRLLEYNREDVLNLRVLREVLNRE